jgi:hypothetical protein
MKKLEYLHGRTQLYWEIGRSGTTVKTRSWGPRRKEYVLELEHRTVEEATRARKQLIAEQRERGFVEPGDKAAAQREAYESVNGPKAVANAKKAFGAILVPSLRAAGFEGSFPKFRRVQKDRHAVIWFDWGRAGGHMSVGLAVLPPKDTTLSQDYHRALNIRNRQRIWLSDLIPASERKLLFFDQARRKWGDAWGEELARYLSARLLDDRAARWLASPARRPKRKTARKS